MTDVNATSAIEAMLTKWESEEVGIGQPNSQARLKEFEQTHQIHLPGDFKQYLLKANGMVPGMTHDTDKNGYCFWPLGRICSAVAELRKPQHCAKAIELAEPELSNYFIFADYLQLSWTFAIRASGPSSATCEVFRINAPNSMPKVANSFADFINLYLVDDVRLYDPPFPHTNQNS